MFGLHDESQKAWIRKIKRGRCRSESSYPKEASPLGIGESAMAPLASSARQHAAATATRVAIIVVLIDPGAVFSDFGHF